MAIFKAINNSSKKIGGSKYILNRIGKNSKDTVGLLCSNDYKKAFKDFQDIKEFYHKLEDRQYKYFIHSFAPNEISGEKALEMTVKLCEEFFYEYQAFIGLQVINGHICNHIILNSVNFETGEKFYYEKKEFEKWRDRADELAKEYGLKVIER